MNKNNRNQKNQKNKKTNSQKRNQGKPPKKFGIGGMVLISLIIIGVIGMIAGNNSSYMTFINDYEKLSYAEFNNELKDSNVKKVQINFESPQFLVELEKGKVIEGKKNKEKEPLTIFAVQNPYKEDFKEQLLLSDVEVLEEKTEAESSGGIGFFGSLLITIGLMFLIIFIMNKVAGRNNPNSMSNLNNKTKAKIVAEVPKVSFTDVAGHYTVKKDFETIIHFLKEPEKYRQMGARLPKGAMLVGPPGTGKTLLAKAVANEANVPFLAISGSDFVEMFVGVGAARVRDLFAEARKHEKAIIFIDEIDAIGRKRSANESNGEREQTLNQLLVELDGFGETDSTIFVMAATNRLEVLDEALVRPGRFDKHITVPLPDKKERLEIINLYKKNKKLDKDVDLAIIAKKTVGFSGSGLESLMNESAIIAVQRKSSSITTEHIDDAFYKVITQGDKKPKHLREKDDEKDLELIAWHEAGHGLVSKLLTNDTVAELNIIPSTMGAGGMLISIPEKEGLYSREYILNRIMVTYAGRAAEHILLGDANKVTIGASNDIQQATKRILSFIKQYGFSDDYGMLDLTNPALGEINIQEEAKTLSKKLYEDTVKLLTKNKDKLKSIAEALLEREVLSEQDINTLINGEELPAFVLESIPTEEDSLKENVSIQKKKEYINESSLAPNTIISIKEE